MLRRLLEKLLFATRRDPDNLSASTYDRCLRFVTQQMALWTGLSDGI